MVVESCGRCFYEQVTKILSSLSIVKEEQRQACLDYFFYGTVTNFPFLCFSEDMRGKQESSTAAGSFYIEGELE